MFTTKFRIDELPKTRNAIADRRWTRKKEADKWHQLVRLHVTDRPESPLNKAQITFTRASSSIPDYDGLVSSFKFVCDALIKCGIIKDDNLKVLEHPTYNWLKTKRGFGYIEVEVEEID